MIRIVKRVDHNQQEKISTEIVNLMSGDEVLKKWLSKNKKVLFAFIFVFGLLIISGYSIVNMTSNASDDKCNGEIKEWSLDYPKAQDPSAFPSPCETSVDLAKLRQAQSLKEIYKQAEKMNVSSVSDNRVLSRAVTEYMQQHCPTYDCVLNELDEAGFSDVQNITKKAKNNPDFYVIGNLEFDRALSSVQRNAKLNFFSYGKFESVYQISVFLKENKVVKVNAYLFYNPLF